MPDFKGTGVALVTPFIAGGRIDFDSLTRLVNHCVDGGVDYLVVLGTTGESATLSGEEKAAVLDCVKQANQGRKPLVLGHGGNDTARLIAGMQQIDWQGVDAILSVSPYYNKPSQAGIQAHYEALATDAPVPVILYNVPGRTGSNMSPSTTLKLAAHPNIIGIKEASGNVEQAMAISAGKPQDFLLISGDDLLTYAVADGRRCRGCHFSAGQFPPAGVFADGNQQPQPRFRSRSRHLEKLDFPQSSVV
jgi:4-hydroxy-tetrahydrodipicolinate synthase